MSARDCQSDVDIHPQGDILHQQGHDCKDDGVASERAPKGVEVIVVEGVQQAVDVTHN